MPSSISMSQRLCSKCLFFSSCSPKFWIPYPSLAGIFFDRNLRALQYNYGNRLLVINYQTTTYKPTRERLIYSYLDRGNRAQYSVHMSLHMLFRVAIVLLQLLQLSNSFHLCKTTHQSTRLYSSNPSQVIDHATLSADDIWEDHYCEYAILCQLMCV